MGSHGYKRSKENINYLLFLKRPDEQLAGQTDKWSGIPRRIGNHRKAAPGKASALSVRINPGNSDNDDADLFQKAHSHSAIVR